MHLKKERAAVFTAAAASAVAILTGTGASFAPAAAAALFLAASVSFAATPFVRLLAYRINAVDVPGDGRRMHDHPIPRIGGLAIIAGFAVATLASGTMAGQLRSLLDKAAVSVSGGSKAEMLRSVLSGAAVSVSGRSKAEMLRSMLPGAVMITALGLTDDIFTLGPWPKLIVQTAAALVTVQRGNVIEFVSGIFGAGPYPLPGWFGTFLSVLWIVGVTNAVNLIDGLDGLACGVSIISSVAVAVVSGLTAGAYAAVPAASLAGACIGFLPYNLNPAWIFMGDTGATFLGYILAVLSIQGLFRYPETVPFAVPCLILGLPVFDTCFAIVRRVAHGRSPLLPDRGHICHRLVDRGLSWKKTVVLLWTVSAVLSVFAAVLVLAGR